MYERLDSKAQCAVDALYNELTLTERIGQTASIRSHDHTPEQVAAEFEQCPFGCVFHAYRTAAETEAIEAALRTVGRVPVMAHADLVNGAGSRLPGETLFPWQMAMGSADSEVLAERVGQATAREGVAAGIPWTFGPIVDLSINQHNSMMHTRTFGEDPGQVLRLSRAYIRGVQSDGRMAATAKHFPGDGIDDRDSHVCTSINSLSESEWMSSYGPIWQGVIDDDVMCVMPGHIALPWIDPATDYRGPMPATLSAKIQIELLRERLNFKGVVVSDAIPMIGFAAMAPYEVRVPMNIETGSDVVLWPRPDDFVAIMTQALDRGILSEARLETAVKNVLALKLTLGVLDTAAAPVAPVTADERAQFQGWADEIGERSISIVRNSDNLLPLQLKAGDKVLTVSCDFSGDTRGVVKNLDVVDDELRRRGIEVDHLDNPSGSELAKVAGLYAVVFMNLHVMPKYGTTRMSGTLTDAFWDAFWPEHEHVVFTAFGDPYKLYEMPYAPNYVMTYSNTPSSQKAVVRVWLGELDAVGKIPVNCPGYYEMDV